MARLVLRLRASRRGAILTELALVAPAAILVVIAAASWGRHATLSSDVQRVADRALAAAESTPDDTARERVARIAAEREGRRLGLAPAMLDVTLQRQAHRLTLLLVYDASATPVFALGAIVPAPSSTITRQAHSR